ncbi:hypothetical protein KIN20_028519 [Parelaphostrongylus tenuis]|uniref:Uncharacterized protein n=1 Tax=Parelaphostrongylus tenuis TaxID=148309 RepID=A0AAD5WES0_PARTN|nr:hypothetical protein KIN20_028519 [Parelaphostrongylus tenuis]
MCGAAVRGLFGKQGRCVRILLSSDRWSSLFLRLTPIFWDVPPRERPSLSTLSWKRLIETRRSFEICVWI